MKYVQTERPDDLHSIGERPAFPPHNYILLFPICDCKKMAPDFHIVLPVIEHPSNQINSWNRLPFSPTTTLSVLGLAVIQVKIVL